MKQLFVEHDGNESACIKSYSDAERKGLVERRKNRSNLSSEEYASALFRDGIIKGWLYPHKQHESYDNDYVNQLIEEARIVAKQYYETTGRPLGVTGEIAEHETCRLLGLDRAPVRQSGYDAVRRVDGREEFIQIKSRAMADNPNPGQRLGSINLEKEWDVVLLALLGHDFQVREIHEAKRPKIEKELRRPGSKARNERGSLTVNKFVSIGRMVWKR